MKLTGIISVALVLLCATAIASAQEKQPPRPSPKPTPAGARDFGQEQQKCPCQIIGDWKAQVSTTEARLYSFDGEGVVKVLKVSGTDKPRQIATGRYEFIDQPIMDETAAPDAKPSYKEISFTATGGNRIFGKTKGTMKIVKYDDSSITCEIPGVKGTVRWTRVDPDRYFMILVARQNEFYDNSGSAFPMVIKLAGGVPEIEAAGTYSNHGKSAFGKVPVEVYKDYLREARADDEVILRLEINSQQYDRALKIVQEWQRRARQNELLYRPPDGILALNNILLLRDVTDTLNLCENDFDLYKLDYNYPRDWISEAYGPDFVPFYFFKELKRRNEARHIEYTKFETLVPLSHLASR